MESQQNDSTPKGPNATQLQTPARVTASTAEDRQLRRVATSGSDERGTSLEFGTNNNSDTIDTNSLADIFADQIVLESKKAKNRAVNLLMGVPKEDFVPCVDFFESCAKNNVNVEAVIDNIETPQELVIHAKTHEVNMENIRPDNDNRELRPFIPTTQIFQEAIENGAPSQQAITTTQNAEFYDWFKCSEVNKPESELEASSLFSATKGIYLSVWVIDRTHTIHFLHNVISNEEYQNLSKQHRNVFDRIICDALYIDKDDSEEVVRLKVGNILEGRFYKRIRNLHQSEGQYAEMMFISTKDLCDEKVIELEKLLKYACSRFRKRENISTGEHSSAIAGVNSEVFYVTVDFIEEKLFEAAKEFVQKGTFTLDFEQCNQTISIRETDMNKDDPQYRYYHEFCLKTDKKCHKNNCAYKNDNGDVPWHEFSQSLKIHCTCSLFDEENESDSDGDE